MNNLKLKQKIEIEMKTWDEPWFCEIFYMVKPYALEELKIL